MLNITNVREMKVKTTMRHHLTLVRMAIIKNLQTINYRESMEKRETSSTVGGNVNWCNHYEKQYGNFLQKLKIGLPYDVAIPLLGKFPQKIIMRKRICTPVFIAALFTTAKTYKKQMYIDIGMDKKDMAD